MKNIFKFVFAAVLMMVSLSSCEDENYRDWTTAEPSFELKDTAGDTNVLYPTMENNPFILTWDKSAQESGGYSVVLSNTEDFASKVELGNTTGTTLTTNVGHLNTVLLQAGFAPYTSSMVYIRVETAGGSVISNSINFMVTPYPSTKPVITSPTSGSSFVLDSGTPDAIVSTVNWTDYTDYGVDVTYLVEIALTGTSDFKTVGTNVNLQSIDLISSSLNEVVLQAGAQPGLENDLDLRVTATTSSVGGTIVQTSDVVTIKVTPYDSYVNLYLIGDATAAGWNNTAGNMDMFPLLNNHSNVNSYTFTGYFAAGGFKIIKTRGSWDEQYGKGSADGELSTDGGSGNISIPSAGYYKVSIDISALTYTIENATAPTVTYATVGIIGSATANGWDASTPMVQSTFDPHVWYLEATALSAGELKFRANNSWDVNWGSGDENYGTATLGGDNIPLSEAGNYHIYFNDSTGDYVLIQQ